LSFLSLEDCAEDAAGDLACRASFRPFGYRLERSLLRGLLERLDIAKRSGRAVEEGAEAVELHR
jgi:hypothetical protein